jgi:hypothetical protein
MMSYSGIKGIELVMKDKPLITTVNLKDIRLEVNEAEDDSRVSLNDTNF